MSLKRLKSFFGGSNADQKEAPQQKEETPTEPPKPPIRVKQTLTKDQMVKAEEELRALKVEREIVSYALTHLYEAEAEQKISEDQRKALVERYSGTMRELEKSINQKELVVDLFNLESAQAQLVDMFYKRFEEVENKVEGIRSTLGLTPKGEKTSQTAKIEVITDEEKAEEPEKDEEILKPVARRMRRSVRPQEDRKRNEAEEKIEAIQQEVLRVLEKLEQMESEDIRMTTREENTGQQI